MRRKCTGKGTSSHFLQPYSGVLILAVKAKPLRGAAKAAALTAAMSRELAKP